jgi:hypothetical protein
MRPQPRVSAAPFCRRAVYHVTYKGAIKMAVARLTVKEDLCRRILDLPTESAEQVARYLDSLEASEPN